MKAKLIFSALIFSALILILALNVKAACLSNANCGHQCNWASHKYCPETCSWMTCGCKWDNAYCKPGECGAECLNGAVERRACGTGNCGVQARICSDTCLWPQWSECALPKSLGDKVSCWEGEVRNGGCQTCTNCLLVNAAVGAACTGNGKCDSDGICMACENTDGGEYFFVKGTAIYANTGQEDTDVCLKKNAGGGWDQVIEGPFVLEYNCYSKSNYECPLGCRDGACILCKDSDGGKNYNVKGIVTYADGRGNNTDTCINQNANGTWGSASYEAPYVVEYSCPSSTNYGKDMPKCQYGCRDGACLTEPTCNDTDKGLNYFKRGTTSGISEATGKEEKINDYCEVDKNSIADPNVLIEYYCSLKNQISAKGYKCPKGCKDGACMKSMPLLTTPLTGKVDYGCCKEGGVYANKYSNACQGIFYGNGIYCSMVPGSGITGQSITAQHYEKPSLFTIIRGMINIK